MSFDELKGISGTYQQRVVPDPEAMTPAHVVAHPVLVSVFRIVEDVPGRGWLWSLVVSLGQLIVSSMFGSLMLLLVAVGVLDYLAGAVVALRDGRWDAGKAWSGIIGKIMGYALSGVVFAAELWAMRYIPEMPDTNGYIATVLAMLLLTVDLQSIEKNRQRLGFRPIPFFSSLVARLQGALVAKLPGSAAVTAEMPAVKGGELPSAFDKPRAKNGGP